MAQPSILPTLLGRARPGIVPSWLSFSRASAATRVNALGLIETVPAGVLRHDYDPISGEYRGWLVEEQRTNLFAYSEAFDNAAWGKLNITVTANAAMGPNGTVSAARIVESVNTGVHDIYASASSSVAVGTTITASFYVRAAGRSNISLIVMGTTDIGRGLFDLTNGTAAVSGAIAATIKRSGNFFRISVTAKTVTAGVPSVILRIADVAGGAAYLGDGASGIHAWGAQFEVGPFASSIIPTAGAAATRNGDVLSVPVTAFPFNANEGTLFIVRDDSGIKNFSVSPQLDDGTGTNFLQVVSGTGGNGVLYAGATGGGQFNASPYVSTAPDAVQRVALSYSASAATATLVINGAVVGTFPNKSVASAFTTLRLSGSPGGGNDPTGHIRLIGYFPRALASADMQTITV